MVKLFNSREEDITSSPSKIGVYATLKTGATKDGIIKALECTYHIDCGAYSDTGPRMAKAIANDYTGPYNIKNLQCNAFTVYTNHCYVTSYRGFGHTAATSCIERMIEKLSNILNMDPFEIRIKNAIAPGNFTPTQDKSTLSNTGDLPKCLSKLKKIINWEDGNRIITDKGTIIAKVLAVFGKPLVLHLMHPLELYLPLIPMAALI